MFVFDQVLVLSRPATRGFKLKYQVYRQPIPLTELVVEDVLETGKQGSFKSAFSQATAGNGVIERLLKVEDNNMTFFL